ncbi:bifunctional RNase H/acid phosphatase [Pedococcus sp. 2YAF34]|uniref:bifunctional RNase H/acid phosphatase n=1 Tax=Pedococcus sp. 2YAF34 TaxID=3233032 RepID=UPI003F951281
MGRALVVEADGGSRGNPGVAGYGALVRNPSTGRVLWEGAAPLGRESNNVAEYSGLIAGLRAAQRIDPAAEVVARLDSKLVVEQMSGRWKIKHEDMRRLALEAREVAAELRRAGGSVEYGWVPRAENKDADALSNAGMDGRTIDRMLEAPSEPDRRAAVADEDAVAEEIVQEIVQEVVEEVVDPTPAAVLPGPGHGPTTRIVLVRHGVTDFTTAARLDGRGGSDPSLNDAGREQAASAGRALAHLLGGSEARLVTSSLARARETGAAVGEAIGATPVVDAAWDEQDFGDWDGASVHDLAREQPDELARLRHDAAYARPGGETHAELAERVLAAYSRVVAAGGTTVVVCHRKPIMVVLADVLGIPHDRVWRLAAAPGSLNALEVWPDGTVSVVFTNRT